MLLALTLAGLFLGLPFFRTVWELRTRRAWQRGETHLHGLRVLAEHIPERPGVWIQVNQQLIDKHRMFGVPATCERVVKVFLRRRDVRISCWPEPWPQHDVAFLSRENYDAWLDPWPGLESTAVFCPGGEMVLVRPSAAGEPPAIFGAEESGL